MAAPDLAGAVPALTLRANDPPEFATLRDLVPSAGELRFVWPDAVFPLVPEAWLAWMARAMATRSYHAELGGRVVGHGAIFGTEEASRAHIAWVYLVPSLRGAGLGQALIAALEAEAARRPGCRRVSLRTNDFNPRALHIYLKRGYREVARAGSTIELMKVMA